MSRKSDEERLNSIVEAIRQNPAQRPSWLARRLGVDNKTMMRALAQLENRGDMLIEDDHGCVSWFGRRRGER